MEINISGKNKAAILAALYNNSHPQGMGLLHFDPKRMSEEEAAKILEQSSDFDYLKGRVLKVNLGGDSFDPRLYDRDNGEGAAQEALKGILDSEDAPAAAETIYTISIAGVEANDTNADFLEGTKQIERTGFAVMALLPIDEQGRRPCALTLHNVSTADLVAMMSGSEALKEAAMFATLRVFSKGSGDLN